MDVAPRSRPQPPWGATILALCLLLSGCEPAPRALLDDYHDRIARVLAVARSPVEVPPLPVLPPRRLRQQEIPPATLSFFEYLKTYECALHLLVSERNSALGKVMPHSQRLLYEIDVINALHACSAELVGEDPALAKLLLATAAAKRSQLPVLFDNMLFGGAEFERFARSSVSPLAPGDEDRVGIAVESLRYFADLRERLASAEVTNAPIAPPDATTLEANLQRLAVSEAYGAVTSAVVLLTAHLDAISVTFATGVTDQPPCPHGRQGPRATVLSNVLRAIYGERVQVYMSQVDRQGQALSEAVAAVLPSARLPALDRYWRQTLAPAAPEGLWVRYRETIQRHVEQWQALLSSCGTGPTGSTERHPSTNDA